MADAGEGSENVAATTGAWRTPSMTAPAGRDMELLLNWLETEVKDRLCLLDWKLDRLAGIVNTGSAPLLDLQPQKSHVSDGSLGHKEADPVQVAGPIIPGHLHVHQKYDSPVQGGQRASDESALDGQRVSNNTIDTLPQDLAIGCERVRRNENTRLSEGSRVTSRASTETLRHDVGNKVTDGSRATAVSFGAELEWKLWSIMHDQDSSAAARCYTVFMRYLVWASVILTLAQTVRPPPLSGLAAAVLETIFDSIFLLEIIVRFIVCPTRGLFLCSAYNLIDLAAAVPLVLRVYIGFIVDQGGEEDGSPICLVLLYVVPVIRILKNLRTFQKFHLLLSAFVLALEGLPVLLFTLAIIVLSCSSLIYLLEPRSNIESLPKAMYFTIITMTTVGYGDIHPSTVETHAVICFTAIVGVLYMAMPIGIIGSAFTETWKARDRILLIKRTRENLFQWGYTAHDIPVLFQQFDLDGDGDLSLREFRRMMRRMRVGLRDDRILKLFRSIDTDGGGTIDAREFMRTCFPEAFAEMYESEGGQGVLTPRTTAAVWKAYLRAAVRPQSLARSAGMRLRSRKSTGGSSEVSEAPPRAEEIRASASLVSPDEESALRASGVGFVRSI